MARLSGMTTTARIAEAEIGGLSPGRCTTDMPEGQSSYMCIFLRPRYPYAFLHSRLYPLKC